mmetsp:Transcript_14034/g.26283  ORF Transcript_14034/g.26283 Transcript_14034/m.26283 type:complete len:410 (+) Transcript_14034:563-1792(+)
MLWILLAASAAAATLSDCVAIDQIYYSGYCVTDCPDNYYRNGWECWGTSTTSTSYSDGNIDVTLSNLYGTLSSSSNTASIGPFVVTTPSSGTVYVTIVSNFGKVTLSSDTGLTFSETYARPTSPYQSATMEFSGTVDDVNTALASMTYTPNTYYSTSAAAAWKEYVDFVNFTFGSGTNYSKIITYNAILGSAPDPRNCENNMKVNNKVCNGHGYCNIRATTASCTCYYPYWDTKCDKKKCVQGCMDTGTSGCNDNGTCACNSGYSGTQCELKDCPNSCTSSSQGICDYTSGTCECFDGYFGLDCSYLRCRSDCNGRGVCDKSAGTCDCYDGYFGEYCESIKCTRDCGSGGGCDFSTGTCKCKDGFEGNDCMYTKCPDDCTSATQGTCNYETGVCSCNEGYAGVSCSYTA